MTPAANFHSKVKKTNTCWLWTASTTDSGYGVLYINRRSTYAHRFAHELFNGHIPDGFEVDHLCRVRHCVNPAHLEAVTPEENRRRCGASKTHCKHGHEYTDANTYRAPGRTKRACRTCQVSRDSLRARRTERAAA